MGTEFRQNFETIRTSYRIPVVSWHASNACGDASDARDASCGELQANQEPSDGRRQSSKPAVSFRFCSSLAFRFRPKSRSNSPYTRLQLTKYQQSQSRPDQGLEASCRFRSYLAAVLATHPLTLRASRLSQSGQGRSNYFSRPRSSPQPWLLAVFDRLKGRPTTKAGSSFGRWSNRSDQYSILGNTSRQGWTC